MVHRGAFEPPRPTRGISALAYVKSRSTKTHVVLTIHLCEGGDAKSMKARAAISLGCAVFAYAPDQFPSMMTSALTGKDLTNWAMTKILPSFGDLRSETGLRKLS